MISFQGLWTCYGVFALPDMLGSIAALSANDHAVYIAVSGFPILFDLCCDVGLPHLDQVSVPSVQEKSSVTF